MKTVYMKSATITRSFQVLYRVPRNQTIDSRDLRHDAQVATDPAYLLIRSDVWGLRPVHRALSSSHRGSPGAQGFTSQQPCVSSRSRASALECRYGFDGASSTSSPTTATHCDFVPSEWRRCKPVPCLKLPILASGEGAEARSAIAFASAMDRRSTCNSVCRIPWPRRSRYAVTFALRIPDYLPDAPPSNSLIVHLLPDAADPGGTRTNRHSARS